MNSVYNLASGTLAVEGSVMALRMRGLNPASVPYLLISRSEISKQQKFNFKL